MATKSKAERGEQDPTPGEVDLDEIDAFLTQGLDSAEEDEDPFSGLTKSARRVAPARKAPPAGKQPEGGEAGDGLGEPAEQEAGDAGTTAEPGDATKPGAEAGTPAAKPRPLQEGAVEVAVDDERMTATLTVRPALVPDLTFDDVIHVLKRAQVRSGIDEDAIIELVHGLDDVTDEEVSLPVAEGTPPAPGKPVLLTVPALQETPLTGKALTGLRTAGDRLRELLETGKAEEADDACAGLPIVLPGAVAVQVDPARPSVAGMDVRGFEVAVDPVAEDAPGSGEGLDPSDDGLTYTATACGYLCIGETDVRVIPVVWVAPDELAAHLLDLAPPNGLPGTDVLLAELQAQGIVLLPEPDGLAKSLENPKNGAVRAVVAAEGRRPQPGKDARIEMEVASGDQVGAVQEDGSIDFKQRNFAASVEPEQLLAVKHPATKGSPGLTVRGEEIPVEAGKDKPLEAGKGVVKEEDKGVLRFHATIEGCVHNQAGKLEVRPELNITGDVDFGTGNVDFKGDLTVAGVVRGGFSVKATGAISVGAGVEDGAMVMAGGALTVSKGIFGSKTRVVAVGSIRAQFVQDASLLCKGNVEIGSYIYNATVRSGGTVTVVGKGEKGGIVGGQVSAKTRIVSSSTGSLYGTETALIAGVDVDLSASLKKVEKGQGFCKGSIEKLMGALNVPSADPKVIGQALVHLPANRRKEMRPIVRKLKELSHMEEKLNEERAELEEQQQAIARDARVEVRGAVNHKVTVFIGREYLRIADPLKGAGFRLSGKGSVKPYALT
jgi:uncharacterized protein